MNRHNWMWVLQLATFVALGTVVAACSKEGGNGSTEATVQFDPTLTIRPDKADYAVLQLSGTPGTSWTARITEGNWVSFDRNATVTSRVGTLGESFQSKEVPVYYTANTTNQDRTAQVTFEYAGQAPVALPMIQYATSGQQTVYDVAGRLERWPEIPAKSTASYTYVTHFCPVRNTSNNTTFNGRNFTLCYDKDKHAAWWVAYPLHATYMGSGRPEPDPWAYDPKIASAYQPNLKRGSYTGAYDRGHQIPNADRNADPNSLMCYQTFYASNATPQTSSLNQGSWGSLEGNVRDWICSDTLYVVTGAYWNEGSTASTTDKDGLRCPLPDYYFKVVARTVAGNIRQKGDLLGNFSASQLQSIGFWVKNAGSQGTPKSWVKSVAEIEQLTGFTFFPTLPADVKQQKNTAAWRGL